MNPSPISTRFDAIIKPYGEMAERFNAAVLKTVERDERSGGSNPPLSAIDVLVNTPESNTRFMRPLTTTCWRGEGDSNRQGAERQENAPVARF